MLVEENFSCNTNQRQFSLYLDDIKFATLLKHHVSFLNTGCNV